MITVQLENIPLVQVTSPIDPAVRFRCDFALSGSTGAADSAVVYMEIEPGAHLGTHTDSQEEVLLVLEGTAEATIGDEHGRLEVGGAAVVPAMVPHDVRNVGDGTLRAVGFFSGAIVYSTFFPSPVPGTDAVVSINGAGPTEQSFTTTALPAD